MFYICKTWMTVLLLCVAAWEGGARLVPRDPKKERALADQLFTNGILLDLKIEITASNLARLRKEPFRYVPATVREGDAVHHDVGIHLKGSAGSFRGIDDKAGLTLNFKTFESGSTFHGLSKFHLNNSVQDPSYVSEWVANDLFRQAGVPAPQVAHAVVQINERKRGLYVLIESNDREFLERYFKNPHGNVYGQKGGGDITDALERMEGKGPLDRADLKKLAAAAQEKEPARRWQRLQETLEVERFLSFMALEVMFSHWDGYTFARHNYRVFQNLETGRMVFLPHDLDQLMGDSNVPFMPGVNGVVAQAVMNTPEARERYRARFEQLFTNCFRVPELTNRIEWLAGRLLPGLRNYDANIARDFVNNANGFKHRLMARAESLNRQLAAARPKPHTQASNLLARAQWNPQKDQGAARLELLKGEQRNLLHIKSESSNCIASWRSTLTLPAGRYRFSGRAKSARLNPQRTETGLGGGIRISGSNRSNQLSGDMDWTALRHDFSVSEKGEVVLVCELRANGGEIWFDAGSLKVEPLR